MHVYSSLVNVSRALTVTYQRHSFGRDKSRIRVSIGPICRTSFVPKAHVEMILYIKDIYFFPGELQMYFSECVDHHNFHECTA